MIRRRDAIAGSISSGSVWTCLVLANGALALEMISNTCPFDVSGHPAATVPAGMFRSTAELNEPIWVTRMKEQYVPAGYTGGALTKAE